MDTSAVPIVGIILAVVIVILAIRVVRSHILGTFYFDNSGDTYRCRLEFEDLDDLERHRFAIVKVKEEGLHLPGERHSQH